MPRKPGSVPVFLPEIFGFNWVDDPHDGPRAWNEAWHAIRYSEVEDARTGETWTRETDPDEAVIELVRCFPQAFDAPNIVRIRAAWKVRNTPRARRLLERLFDAYLKGSQHQGRGNALSRLRTSCRSALLFAEIARISPRPVPRTPPDLTRIAAQFRVTNPNAHAYWREVFDSCVAFRERRARFLPPPGFRRLGSPNPFAGERRTMDVHSASGATLRIAPPIPRGRYRPDSLDHDRDVLPYVRWLEYVFAKCLAKLVDYLGGPARAETAVGPAAAKLIGRLQARAPAPLRLDQIAVLVDALEKAAPRLT